MTQKNRRHAPFRVLGCQIPGYEISNYALPGWECRHNSGYWTGHPYLGLGIGAASYVNGTRFSNCTDLREYLEVLGREKDRADATEQTDKAKQAEKTGITSLIRTDLHSLSAEEQMEEFMFLGLRMTKGVRSAVFTERFGKSIEQVYGRILERHISQGVLEKTPGGYRLTDRGVDVSNYVLADYLLQ